jgi:hypothetical protein
MLDKETALEQLKAKLERAAIVKEIGELGDPDSGFRLLAITANKLSKEDVAFTHVRRLMARAERNIFFTRGSRGGTQQYVIGTEYFYKLDQELWQCIEMYLQCFEKMQQSPLTLDDLKIDL